MTENRAPTADEMAVLLVVCERWFVQNAPDAFLDVIDDELGTKDGPIVLIPTIRGILKAFRESRPSVSAGVE
jgi:hypothetical protein